MKKKSSILVAAIIISALFVTTAFAAGTGGYKKITAWFGNIKIIANGKTLESNPQPLLYNNTTYVPIRLISESLGQSVGWNQKDKVVTISGSTANSDAIIAQKNATIATLQTDNTKKAARIAELEAQLKENENRKNASSDLEDYLEDKYSTWKRMDFDYNARGDAGDLKLTIKVDLSEDGSRWNNTDKDDIEDWLDDIYDYVHKEYKNADFSGEIVDSDSRDTLAEFESSGSRLKISFNKRANADDLEKDLNKKYGSDLVWYDDSFGSMTAKFRVSANKNRERVNITVTVSDKYKNVNKSGVKLWISDVVDATYDYFNKDYDIIGEIINSNGDTLDTFDEGGLD